METGPKMPFVRLWIRRLAGVGCLLFFYAAIMTAFPKMIGNNGQPNLFFAAQAVSGVVLFALIAAGKFPKID